MKISNALYTYPVLSLSGLRDDYKTDSSFSAQVEKIRTGINEVSLVITIELIDDGLTDLINSGNARIVCHIESSLSSYRAVRDVGLFDSRIVIPIEPSVMRGMLEITPFIVATQTIDSYSNVMFGEFYAGSYKIDSGDILAFAPTIEAEIEPEELDKRPTQSIIKISGHDRREMTIDLTGEYILIRLPKETYSGYKMLSGKENSHHKLSLMAVVLPALMEAMYEMKTGDGSSDEKVWSRVIRAKMKAGGRGAEVSQYDPLVHSQFLLNNPADNTFAPIIDNSGDD